MKPFGAAAILPSSGLARLRQTRQLACISSTASRRRWSCSLFSPYFLYQALRHNKYVGSLGQRLGYLPVSFNLDGEASIWVHAVSVGEVLAARPVIGELRKQYPALRLFLSTTTRSGQQLARRSADGRGRHLLFPVRLDVHRPPDAARVQPRLFVMVESEIWPNLLRECRAAASRRWSSTAGSRTGRFRATAW